jgi:uncharacterized damage-inducible protein DinB
VARDLIDSITAEYRRYKQLGEGAFAQLTDEELSRAAADDNSVAAIVWHIAGNLKSRFTDFQTTDGEKPWRNRDEEFAERTVTRQALVEKWEDGWRSLFAALDALADDKLNDVVTIRQQPLTIHQALHRSLAHTSYHVGQIVYVAKAFRGAAWRSLSIPKGASAAFMQRGDPLQRSANPRT